MTESVYGHDTTLFVGLPTSDNRRQQSVSLMKCGGVTEQIRTNTGYGEDHPLQWLGRIICSFVERIGDSPIYSEFKASEFRRLPPAILKAPMVDVDYLVVLGHMFTYGPLLKLPGEHKCTKCGKKNVDVELDLTNLEHKDSEVENTEEFWAQLPNGFFHPLPNNPDPNASMEYMGIQWNRYFFRVPTLGDAIKHEAHFNQATLIEFNMRVARDCLLRVERWEKDSDQPPDGEQVYVKTQEMEKKHIAAVGQRLFSTLEGPDRNVIRALFNKLPRVDMTMKYECRGCGRDVPIDVNYGHFFPLV